MQYPLYIIQVDTGNPNHSCDVLGDGYSDCKTYVDGQDTYYYWYPNDDNIQYLYESFPNVVNPIEGVKNEHFINWMRTAGLPFFRKLYGKIDSDFAVGDTLSFQIDVNFEVQSFGGSKALVLTTLSDLGAKNSALGYSFIILGSINLVIGVIFALKRAIRPRPLGDIRQLGWNS